MNLYFLVEGKRTESKVYPYWLKFLMPNLSRVSNLNDVNENNYFLISAEGFPSILQTHLINAIKDVEHMTKFDYLVIILDADEYDVKYRIEETKKAISSSSTHLKSAKPKIIIQNRCIETWFLGNTKLFPRNPLGINLKKYLNYYNIKSDDPEKMGCFSDFNTISQFHVQYLRELFWEKNINYSKKNPRYICNKSYLDQLLNRINTTNHLKSFEVFVNFCAKIN